MTQPNPTSDNEQQTASLSNDAKPNSATFIFAGLPQTEMVRCTDMTATLNWSSGPYHIRYLQNVNPSGSPFVNRPSNVEVNGGGGSGDRPGPDGNGGSKTQPFAFPASLLPANFGGDDDDIPPDDVDDTFKLDAIGGLEEHKEYLKRSIILPLAFPNFLKEWGISPPKGILLHGPPGTGKTFMAKALVNELKKELKTKVNFFYRKGGDVFSMWFGESQRKLRQVFETAKAMAPSIIFFDEIDGLCPSRDGKNHGTEAYSSVVTCFLGQMDGLENGKVFVIASTNRLDAVDSAVRRPGRFDKQLAFSFPDELARQKIIEIHTSKWGKDDQPPSEIVRRLAQKTMGFSGADLEKLCKDVVYCAIEDNGGDITDNMKITEDHWIRAMSGMQRTAISTFGSALYMPTKPGQIVSLLINPLCEQVINKMSPMLTASSLNMDSTTIRNSFLICIKPSQSKSFLNNQIIPGILSNPLFNKMALFEMSMSSLLNKVISGAKPNILAAMYDVINQAQDAQTQDNCSLVKIENINELLDLIKANNISTMLALKAIAKIRGPKMFLLATSSMPLDEIKEPRVTELFFHRFIQVTDPGEQELKEFFQALFQEKATAHPHALPVFNQVAEKAANLLDNHDYERILNVANAMVSVTVPVSLDWKTMLEQNFNEVWKKCENSQAPSQ